MNNKIDTRPLPRGWVVRASRSRNGRTYFFNLASGESSWKHPCDLENKSVPKPTKKVRHREQSGTDSSVTSGETPAKRSKVLSSPPSQSSLNASVVTVINKAPEVAQDSTKCNKLEKDLPKTDASDMKPPEPEPEPYPDSDAEGPVKIVQLSAKQPQFACSRTKANHIADWVNHVNNAYEPTEQGSVISEITSTIRGDLDEIISLKENPQNIIFSDEKDQEKVVEQENNKKESPEKEPKAKEKIDKPRENETTQSNKVTQSSETINQDKPKNGQRKSIPPLRKVKPRYRSTSNGSNSNSSSTRPSLSSPTSKNVFTPFGKFQQQQSEGKKERVNITSTPMNIDRAGINCQKFSNPFKSPSDTIPNQGYLSTPISTGSLRNSFSTSLENNFQNQPSFAGEFSTQSLGKSHLNFETTQEMSSPQMDENVLQPDSGFDEVIDMDIDNCEELAETIKAELQEVRSDFQLDKQKIQQGKTFTDSSSYGDGIYIILDTNVLLSHLKFISELKDFPVEGVGRPILVVPWIVMQELDSLKSDSWKIRQGKIVNQETKEDSSLGVDSLARQAVRFLHSCFEAKHPRIRGQTLDEASEHMVAMLEESNDDRILHCCLLFKRKVSNGHSILFSNDQNLCSKAMVNGIHAFSHQTLVEGLKELVGSNQNMTVALQGNYFKEYYEQLSVQQQLAEKRAKADDIMCELQCIMREGLSVIVEAEMRLAYDNLWDKIVYIKPPWTLQDLLIIINKHWIAVFGDVVNRKLQETVKELTKSLDPQKGASGCMANAAPIVDLARKLFDGFASHSSYNGAVTQCVAAIAVLQQKCKEDKRDSLPKLTLPPEAPLPTQTPALLQPEPSSPSSGRIEEVGQSSPDDAASVVSNNVQGEISTSPSSQPHRQVLSTFEMIWSAVTQFSAQIFNVLSYPNPIPPSVIENLPKPTRDEAIVFLGRLCRCLGSLVSSLQSVLRVPVESLKEEPQSLQTLLSSIGSFLLEILNQESPVSAEGLFYFCQDSSSRSALVQGLSQLDRALAMLQHCASCIV